MVDITAHRKEGEKEKEMGGSRGRRLQGLRDPAGLDGPLCRSGPIIDVEGVCGCTVSH